MSSSSDSQGRSMRTFPFAYGAAGQYLVTTEDDHVVWISCLEDDTCCSYEEDEPVAGVRTTPHGILVVDTRGKLTLVDVENTEETLLAECNVPATGLATAGQNVWAVLHRDGVCVGRSKQIVQQIEVPGATCVAFDDLGGLVCVGTQDGEALTFDLETKQRRSVSLKEPVTGLNWSRLGWWLITTPHQLTRAERDLSRLDRLHTPEGRAAGGVVSPDGCLCAFRQDEREVVVFGINEGGVVSRASYPVRKVGEIEFGPFPWLGIGIDKGDCNCVSLVDVDSILCAPNHPDRRRKAWKIVWELKDESVHKERQRLRAAGLLPPEEEEDEDLEEGHDDLEEEEDNEDEEFQEEDEDLEPAVPPFTLAPGEGILLRGGFGGQLGWVWLGGLLFLSLFGIALPLVRHLVQGGPATPLGLIIVGGLFLVTFAAAFWPVLRSGTYWLTTHRLHWKPRLGKAVALSVEELDREQGRIYPLTSSLSLGGPQPVSLRYIRGLERLWGGLLLLNELGAIDLPEEEGEPTEAVWYPAKATEGLLTSQQGVAVLRSGYLAFLPTHKPRHVLKAFFLSLFKNWLSKVFGFELPETNVQVPFDRFVPLLLKSRQDEFDNIIFQAVQQFESILWEEGEAEVTQEGLLLRGNRQALLFRQGSTKVYGVPPREQLPFVECLLPEWTDGRPVPRRQPIWRGLMWAVGLTIPALLFAWGANSMSKAARLDLGEVTPAQAIDPDAVPALSFVTLSGHPDLKHRPYPVGGTAKKEATSLMVVLQEQPRLILYVQKNHPLNQALQPYRSGDQKALSPEELQAIRQAWTVEGRIYNGGQSAAPFLNFHWSTIRKYAVTELGASSESDIRVLAVGMKAKSMAGNAWLAWGMALILGAPAGALWLLTLRAGLRARG